MHYEKTSDEKFFYLFYRSEHDGSSEPTFTAPHCHGAYELLVVTRGSVEAVLNGEVKTVSAGEVLFMDRYDILGNGIEIATYSDGSRIVGNFADEAMTFENISIPAKGYVVM